MRSKRLSMAAIAGGLALAAWIGCGGEQTVASKSAAAFREAQERGETFGGGGHAHGAATPGGEDDAHAAHDGAAGTGEAAPGEEHGGTEAHGGHAVMGHGQHPAAPGAGTGLPSEHAGHGAVPRGSPPAGTPPAAGHAGHAPPAGTAQPPAAGHAGHAPGPGGMRPAGPAPAPTAVPPGLPAATLRPDPLDAAAATSLIDARRAAEIAGEMAGGGHGAHGAGTYRQRDAGRGPEHQHDPDEPPAQRKQQPEKAHEHERPGGGSIGGSALVERRRG